MSPNTKTAIIFGSLMAITQCIVDYDTLLHGSAGVIAKTVIAAVIGGAVAGLLFGWLIGKFLNSKTFKASAKFELQTGEEIIYSGPANHFKGAEGVGGHLGLTNQGIHFKSHKFNLQNHALFLPLNTIAHVDIKKTMAILNNGLLITTSGGNTERFVVHTPKVWLAHINNMLQNRLKS